MRWNLAAAALAVSWGLIAIIVAHVRLPAEALAFWRVAIAAAVLAGSLAALGRLRLLRVPPGLRLRTGAVGVMLAAHWYLFFETIKLASVAVALIAVATAPLFIALAAPLVLPEARSRLALAAVVPGAAGVVLVALEGGAGGRGIGAGSLAAGLGTGVTYAALVISTKGLSVRVPVAALAFWPYAVASVCLAPAAAFAPRLLPRGGEIGFVLVLGVVFTALSGLLNVRIFRHVTAQAMGVLAYLEPVSGALLAWALLGQPLGWGRAAGGVLVLGAGLAVALLDPAEALPLDPLLGGEETNMLATTREGV